MKESIEYSIHQLQNYQLLNFQLPGSGIVEPEILKEIKLPASIDFKKGVIISGKGPIWLYAHLVHLLHISAWVAVYDPRIGAVVVQSHSKKSFSAGDVLPSEEFISLIKH